MEKIKVQVGRILSFNYAGVLVRGKVEMIVSSHAFIRLHKDFTSNAGKLHKEGEKVLFQIRLMEDVTLHDEY